MDPAYKVDIAADGGLDVLGPLFRLPGSPSPSPSVDAILVSFDLETSGSSGQRDISKVNKKEVSTVREVASAVLDTRCLAPISQQQQQPHLAIPVVSTKQFSTLHDSKDFEDCDITNFRECLFSSTSRVDRAELVNTITSCFHFPGRNIIIVGQSPQRDLEIVRQLGVELGRVSPILAVLDTHRLSKSILGPGSPLAIAGQRPALETHKLSSILTELGVPFSPTDLHNAGNDATYTLYALILLAIRHAEAGMAEDGLTQNLRGQVERLRALVRAELEVPRWRPIRRALGAHARDEDRTDEQHPNKNSFHENSRYTPSLDGHSLGQRPSSESRGDARQARKLGSGLEILASSLRKTTS